MKFIQIISFIFTAQLFLLSSCGKKLEQIEPIRIIELNENVRINDFIVLGDSVWIACGGQRDENGFIWRSTDRGVNWDKWTAPDPSSVYCLALASDGSCWAGGDFLRLWKSSNAGLSWEFQWLGEQVPLHEEDRPAVREMQFGADSCWYFCGGENLGEGVVYFSESAGVSWNFRFFQHEMRAVHVIDKESILAGGHGVIMRSEHGLESLNELPWENDFISTFGSGNQDQLISVGLQGGIYLSQDKGKSWMNKLRRRRIGRTSGFFDLEVKGAKAVSVGYRGVVAWSHDSGNSWSQSELEESPDLYSIALLAEEQAILTADNGRVYIIDTP